MEEEFFNDGAAAGVESPAYMINRILEEDTTQRPTREEKPNLLRSPKSPKSGHKRAQSAQSVQSMSARSHMSEQGLALPDDQNNQDADLGYLLQDGALDDFLSPVSVSRVFSQDNNASPVGWPEGTTEEEQVLLRKIKEAAARMDFVEAQKMKLKLTKLSSRWGAVFDTTDAEVDSEEKKGRRLRKRELEKGKEEEDEDNGKQLPQHDVASSSLQNLVTAHKRVRNVLLLRCLKSMRRRHLRGPLTKWKNWLAASQKEEIIMKEREERSRKLSIGAEEVAVLIRSVRRKLLKTYIRRKTNIVTGWALRNWMRCMRSTEPSPESASKKQGAMEMPKALQQYMDKEKKAAANSKREEIKLVAKRAAQRAIQMRKGDSDDLAHTSENQGTGNLPGGVSLDTEQRSVSSEEGKIANLEEGKGRICLWRVVDNDGVCFRMAPSMSEGCRHPEGEGIDLGDIVMGAQGPPGWIKTFPERFYVPLRIEGHTVLEMAKLRAAPKQGKESQMEKSPSILEKLRLAMHGNNCDDSSESSELDADDLGGAIDGKVFADVEDKRNKGEPPPAVPMAIGILRITCQEIDDKNSQGLSKIEQQVLTGIAKLIPEWVHVDGKGWVVLRIALHVFSATPEPEMPPRRRRLALPRAGHFVAKYELEGSLVEADPENSKIIIVHLPGQIRRIFIECPEDVPAFTVKNNSFFSRFFTGKEENVPSFPVENDSLMPAEGNVSRKITLPSVPSQPRSRAEWISLIALCSGPPELIDNASILHAMLALTVASIEDEGRLGAFGEDEDDALTKKVQKLHEDLAAISNAISRLEGYNDRDMKRAGRNGSARCMVRVKLQGHGSSMSQHKFHETMGRIKLTAVTRLVEKRRSAGGGASDSAHDSKKLSLKLKDYRLLLIGRGRPRHCEDEESLESILGKACEKSKGSDEKSKADCTLLAAADPSAPLIDFILEPISEDEPTICKHYSAKVVEHHFLSKSSPKNVKPELKGTTIDR
eukprot:CAMPEP_0184490438 /NCGR_PEP_ID=MMETSP0113_2-20130426/17883_1 /TAXON_ID=91329 /ORGANISM="Norrisiella sphaerica, Strain BC52" /LENGTH=989 /DNA_ID=CAMNT_0026874319 /DNA_START=259 /DNA_END=3228 /DNA_ORIENTATION=-